ncbi:zinc finger matrin-type protein 5 [Brevipalpus obovatus]|uniref:zinc finger matrin-type protein 5 n=1 Tax=Brevipalpus obovatus TaxID=246614 RepID=UPI003D9DE292
MGRTFLCDFCDRSFRDTNRARRLHQQSLKHQEARKAYYANFRDETSVLEEMISKPPCIWFKQGKCRFGDECKNSHLSQHELDQLKTEVASKSQPGEWTEASKSDGKRVGQYHRYEGSSDHLASFDRIQNMCTLNGLLVPPSLYPPSLSDDSGNLHNFQAKVQKEKKISVYSNNLGSKEYSTV